MANGWTKYCLDGSRIKGTDIAIKAKAASWRASDGMPLVAVELETHGRILKIEGLGDYWQSDKFEASQLFPEPKIISRKISRLISDQDVFFSIKDQDIFFTVSFLNHINNGRSKKIPRDWLGKWFNLELDVKTRTIKWYLSEKK